MKQESELTSMPTPMGIIAIMNPTPPYTVITSILIWIKRHVTPIAIADTTKALVILNHILIVVM